MKIIELPRLYQNQVQWKPLDNSNSTPYINTCVNPDMMRLDECLFGSISSFEYNNGVEVSVSKVKDIRRIYLISLMNGCTKMTFDPGVSTSMIKITKADNTKVAKRVKEIMLANANITNDNRKLAQAGILLTE